MTADLLPPIVSSPFGKHFDRSPYTFRENSSLLSAFPDTSSTSLNTLLLHRHGQASPVSIHSIASAPQFKNDENKALPRDYGLLCSTSLRSFSAGYAPPKPEALTSDMSHKHGEAYRWSNAPIRYLPLVVKDVLVRSSANANGQSTMDGNLGEERKTQTEKELHIVQPSQTVEHVVAVAPTTRGAGTSSPCVREDVDVDHGSTHSDCGTVSESTPVLKRHCLASSSTDNAFSSEQATPGHRKRLSTSSSKFVHTLKTASFSNGSFSFISKSFHLGRPGVTHGIFGSHHRFSTDSERPITNTSMDDAAFRRSLKRRQILEELTMTEESYVNDLKALLYLMSTLLASAGDMSSYLRTSIHQNVLDLVHLHEQILEQLHRSSFNAAARKWADTVSPRRLGASHHVRWQSFGYNTATELARIDRQKNKSIESADPSRTLFRFTGADPAEVSDVIRIFHLSISRFFAYEEYCANHEIIAHELQRHIPNLWSTYETGMESLARSLISLERRDQNGKRGVTVGDLLIKPIQRVCRYPLLLEDLLKQTPVADCPSAHAEIEVTLQCFRDVVQVVNTATDSHQARLHIQRRWSLQGRLDFSKVSLQAEDFRTLGNPILCGVLHVAYQTRNRVDGAYALSILFENSFIVAIPAGANGKFDLVAYLDLSDLKIESASDGKGLQCQSALHTWKICFAVEGHLHEFVFSACSASEERQWKRGLRGELKGSQSNDIVGHNIQSSVGLALRSVGTVYGHGGSLARRLSVQRAATVGNRASICQVVVRNTHNPQDLHEIRQVSTAGINRSQSHLTTHRIAVLAPKRSERARLETMLADVWTKERLPFPGMIASRSGQIIRASAGSLVRKLSLASIHAPFSRRSGSLTLSSRKPYDTVSDGRKSRERGSRPTFEVRRDSIEEMATPVVPRKQSSELPELDTMDQLVNRMIRDTTHRQKLVLSRNGTGRSSGVNGHKASTPTLLPIGPDDPASGFYSEEIRRPEKEERIEEGLAGRKKRWGNPIGLLKGLSAESIRHMLYSTK